VNSLLAGIKLVQINGVLSPIRTGGQALAQIGLIVAGAGTAALFIGHILGSTVAILLGGYYLHQYLPSIGIPERRHFSSLFDFAKFSWLGNLQSRMFNYTDVLVLGFFVSSNLIGVYSAAWNIGQFLILFSSALRSTLFPEMSNISAQKDPRAVSRIVKQSLTFSGLILIPGLFGGILLGERILQIYGPKFSQGAEILIILIVANLFMGYQQQLLNTLNAINRPDLAFRVNVVFVASNIALNIVLIYFYGWLGAAVATATSVVISLVLAYRQVDTVIDFEVPVSEISRQWAAAAVMTVVVYGGLQIETTYHLIDQNFVVVVVLIALGAVVYSSSLFIFSKEFRKTIDRNVPVTLPFVSR
jgi:O-antigen/teichoic acid export membrane protein